MATYPTATTTTGPSSDTSVFSSTNTICYPRSPTCSTEQTHCRKLSIPLVLCNPYSAFLPSGQQEGVCQAGYDRQRWLFTRIPSSQPCQRTICYQTSFPRQDRCRDGQASSLRAGWVLVTGEVRGDMFASLGLLCHLGPPNHPH